MSWNFEAYFDGLGTAMITGYTLKSVQTQCLGMVGQRL